MYYHNWFSGNNGKKYMPDSDAGDLEGPPRFESHAFWVGIMSVDGTHNYRSYVESPERSLLDIRRETVTSFAHEAATRADIYEYGAMPAAAQEILGRPWELSCSSPTKGIWRRGISLLESDIDGEVGYLVKCPDDLRSAERTKYYPRGVTTDQHKRWHFAFYFDTRPISKRDAAYSLIVTGFICVVLCMASLGFAKDANRLVLQPVEQMINRVETIRADPLIAVQMSDEEFKHEEKEKALLRAQRTRRFYKTAKSIFNCESKDVQREGIMETVILEKTIIKLGSLLALGFGEAGANIIGHNLEASDSAGVNGMVPGVCVEAIIGVARIAEFSVATEVLKSKVMTFVNQISEIVHGVVSEFHGASNQNNGETFMLIWRISGLADTTASRMADFSTIAFARILGAVHRSPLLANYRVHPAMQQLLGEKARVHLTFGLHHGWAIEGAVGSEFKIDASYLSPNVSIAVQVEEATAIYHVPLLATERVLDLCSPVLRANWRRIDRVIIRGSVDAIDISCLDLDYMSLTIDTDKEHRPATWNTRLRFKARQFIESEKSRKLGSHCSTLELFENEVNISKKRRNYSSDLQQHFNITYDKYYEGEWQCARRLLSEARTMLHYEDGPSAALLRFMEGHRYEAPDNWKGYHDLFHGKSAGSHY
jgi:class 3 adenylate cyclase